MAQEFGRRLPMVGSIEARGCGIRESNVTVTITFLNSRDVPDCLNAVEWLRDRFNEAMPLPTFFARKLALSDEWQVVRRSDSVDFIAKCDNEAMAKQIAKLMNDEAK